MSRLTEGMYNSETPGLFGLKSGQGQGKWWQVAWWWFTTSEIIAMPSSRWYNKAGEQLGSGSLNAEDFRQIFAGLEEGELFIVLPKQGSREDLDRPDFLAAYASYVLAPGIVYQVLGQKLDEVVSRSMKKSLHGIGYLFASREEVAGFVKPR